MIKTICSVILSLLVCTCVTSQITVQLSTLPDIGDQLLYQSILADTIAAKVDNQVFQTGANLQWDFTNLSEGTETEENYISVTLGTVADSFPSADIALDFIGLQGFAKRNTTDISILGVAGDSVAGFAIPIVGELNSPFVIRRAPFGYEDQFSTNSSFSVTLDASVLDTIQEFQDLVGRLPGTTVDSLRVTLSIDRSEIVNGWGVATIPSGVAPVLKMTQNDAVTTSIEIYTVTFAGSDWVNLSPFLPAEIQNLLSVNTTNHLFFSADKKEIVAEFAMAADSTLISTRYARDIKSGLFDAGKFENKINVSIYPNPTSDWLDLNFKAPINSNTLTLQLYNIEGKLLIRRLLNRSNSRIDLSQFDNGIHFITIRSEAELLYRKKLIIAKSH